MSPRVRAVLVLATLLVLAVVVPALLAYSAGLEVGRDQRVTDLEQRVDQLTTDVSLMRE